MHNGAAVVKADLSNVAGRISHITLVKQECLCYEWIKSVFKFTLAVTKISSYILIPLVYIVANLLYFFFFLQSLHFIFHLALFNDLQLMCFPPPSFHFTHCMMR